MEKRRVQLGSTAGLQGHNINYQEKLKGNKIELGNFGRLMRGGQKVLSLNILDYNFFHSLYISETCIFTDPIISLLRIWCHRNL